MAYTREFLNLCYEITVCVSSPSGLMHSLEDTSPDVKCPLVRFKAFMWPKV